MHGSTGAFGCRNLRHCKSACPGLDPAWCIAFQHLSPENLCAVHTWCLLIYGDWHGWINFLAKYRTRLNHNGITSHYTSSKLFWIVFYWTARCFIGVFHTQACWWSFEMCILSCQGRYTRLDRDMISCDALQRSSCSRVIAIIRAVKPDREMKMKLCLLEMKPCWSPKRFRLQKKKKKSNTTCLFLA